MDNAEERHHSEERPVTAVRDNPEKNRYEIFSGDELAGFSEYKLTPGKIAFTHTELDPGFNGRGLARVLVTEALDDTRRRGLAVLPFCPYVRKVIASNPERYLDLVPLEARERFKLPDGADVDNPDLQPVSDTELGR